MAQSSPMARQDQGPIVTVFGGSGFIGRHLVRALVKGGWRVRVAVRRPDLAGHVQPLGMPGQIYPVQANLRYPDSIAHALKGADAAVNLVGILHETGRQRFGSVQARGAEAVARAAAAEGIAKFVHMSALGADAASPSQYAQSKAYGEAAVRQHCPAAGIVRPSVVFGPEDDFFNRFAGLARLLPVLPLISGNTKFQPVYVADVAAAIASLLDGKGRPGAVFELGGPRIMTMREIFSYVLEVTGRKRPLIPVPAALAEFQGALLGLLPKPMLTRDQVLLLKADNVVSKAAVAEHRVLQSLGITPTAVESVVPGYLWRFRKSGQFERSSEA